MSLGNQKNVIIFVAVAAALVAGTVLLAGYADILPAASDKDSQVKACPAADGNVSCQAKTDSAAFPTVCAAGEAATGCCGKPCPPDCTKPCCSGEAPAGCCGKPVAPKPCCPGVAPTGCCPKPGTADAAGGCCGAKTDAATE
ncbi:MAG: hypothetical protein ACYSYV_08935 [Planctomycetota bacterium]|jgi:hypothetical protein